MVKLRFFGTLVIAVIAGFSLGYYCKWRSDEVFLENSYYINLITDTRWRLITLDAIKAGDISKVEDYSLRVLESNAFLLKDFDKNNKLGPEGREVLEKAKGWLQKK